MLTLRPITKMQKLQLIALQKVGAVSAETAVCMFDKVDMVNVNVLGMLHERGLTASKARRPAGGSQRTYYWLTPPGAAVADVFARAEAGPVEDLEDLAHAHP